MYSIALGEFDEKYLRLLIVDFGVLSEHSLRHYYDLLFSKSLYLLHILSRFCQGETIEILKRYNCRRESSQLKNKPK